MPTVRLISIDQPGDWNEALACCGAHDCYHQAGYHLLAREQAEGEPLLFCFEDCGRHAALPLLLRSVAEVDGLESFPWREATSVYGYPGMVASMCPDAPQAEPFRASLQAALQETLQDLRVVACFTRQNPLIDTAWLLSPTFETLSLGPTVSIDLTRSEQEQIGDMRHGHRYEVRLARRQGMVVREDTELQRIELFQEIYRETMDRLSADAHYYFPSAYFAGLKRRLGDRVRLFFSEQDGEPLADALFLLSDHVVQYHLSGTATRFLNRRGATKLILDEVRTWAARNGFSRFHLGGGLGAREGPLFEFKAGFSSTRHRFQIARRIIDPKAYRELVACRVQWLERQGHEFAEGDFFPDYRRQAVRRAA
jgi:hypothetical protein